MSLETIKALFTTFAPWIGVGFNFFLSARKKDVKDLRRRVATLERAFGDLYSLVTEFLDEIEILVDGLPHNLRAPFRSHMDIFRSNMQRQRDRIQAADPEEDDK